MNYFRAKVLEWLRQNRALSMRNRNKMILQLKPCTVHDVAHRSDVPVNRIRDLLEVAS